jgi:hypothetical protein
MISITDSLAEIRCDVCSKPITDASLALAMQPRGSQSAWHVHKTQCARRAVKMLELSPRPIAATVELETHIRQLTDFIPAIPAGCEHDGQVEIDVPSPAAVADSLLARAWDDEVSDGDRLLLEQGAVAIQQLMGRCLALAAAGERREAKGGQRK